MQNAENKWLDFFKKHEWDSHETKMSNSCSENIIQKQGEISLIPVSVENVVLKSNRNKKSLFICSVLIPHTILMTAAPNTFMCTKSNLMIQWMPSSETVNVSVMFLKSLLPCVYDVVSSYNRNCRVNIANLMLYLGINILTKTHSDYDLNYDKSCGSHTLAKKHSSCFCIGTLLYDFVIIK